MPDRLDEADARHLLVLRSMLLDAVRYAHAATPLQRATATVLLDGVCERALHFIAATRGVDIPRNNYELLLERVIQDLKPRWKPARLPDVRQLHRARNSAQHEGLPPDREQLGPWASAVGGFIRSLVQAQFEVDLDRVALTDAVVDNDLRVELEDAARAIAERRPDDSVRSSRNAVDQADEAWRKLHSRRTVSDMLAFRPIGGGSRDPIEGSLRRVERRQRLETFAASPAEAAWFDQLAHERAGHLDLDDAERAFAFGVAWVLAFETAQATWTPDRRARADRNARLLRSGSGPAFVKSVTNVDAAAADASVYVTIADVPNEDFDAWLLTVTRLLRESAGSGPERWQLYDDGTARLRISDLSVLEDEIDRLAEALAGADARLRADHQKDAAAQHAANRRAEQFSSGLDAIGPLPTWVERASREEQHHRGPAIVLHFAPDTAGQSAVADALRADARVHECSGFHASSWTIRPILEPTELFSLLWSVDPVAQEAKEERVRREDERRRLLAELAQRAERAVKDRRPASSAN